MIRYMNGCASSYQYSTKVLILFQFNLETVHGSSVRFYYDQR